MIQSIHLSEYKQPVLPFEPGLRSLTDCILLPEYSGAVHFASDELLEFSYLRRGDNMKVSPYPTINSPEASITTEISKVILIPYFEFSHFGHLLTETAGITGHFMGEASAIDSETIICVNSKVQQYIDSFCRVFNICREKVQSPKRFLMEKVFVHDLTLIAPTIINSYAISSLHLKNVKSLINLLLIDQEKNCSKPLLTCNDLPLAVDRRAVYVSRSMLSPHQRLITNEVELEALLKRQGWFIFHPQNYTIEAQMNVFSDSVSIVGPAGSAFHLLMGVDQLHSKSIKILNAGGFGNVNFANQFTVQGANAEFLSALIPAPDCKKRNQNAPGDPDFIYAKVTQLAKIITE